MNWNRVSEDSALAEDVPLEVTLEGKQFLLVRHRGEVFATDSRCPHMGGRLRDGRVTENGHIVCPLHHSEFNLRTGEIQAWAPWPPGVGPLLGAVRQQRPLRVYPTRVSDGAIWIGTAPAAAG